MAQDDKTPTAAEKGKGKMVDAGNKKAEEPKRDKDGKLITNGKEDGEHKEGGSSSKLVCRHDELDACCSNNLDANRTLYLIEELSEEDQQLKSELEMLVERLLVRLVFFYLQT